MVPPARLGETVAATRLRLQLTDGVEHYRSRFGRPFLIRADGRSPVQLLVQLWSRLGHDVDTEAQVVAQQLRQSAVLQLSRTLTR